MSPFWSSCLPVLPRIISQVVIRIFLPTCPLFPLWGTLYMPLTLRGVVCSFSRRWALTFKDMTGFPGRVSAWRSVDYSWYWSACSLPILECHSGSQSDLSCLLLSRRRFSLFKNLFESVSPSKIKAFRYFCRSLLLLLTCSYFESG